jgi:glycosyltransferase involved in cell wall biosynthesis
MRVLHIVNHMKDVGNGITNAVVDLSVAQAHANTEVYVASGTGELVGVLEKAGVSWKALSKPSLANLRTMRREVRGIISDVQPDIVHTHTPAALLSAYRTERRPRRPPVVASMHNLFDPKTNVYALADKTVAVSDSVAQQLRRRPWFVNSTIATVLNGPVGTRRRNIPTVDRLALDGTALLCVSGLYARKGIYILLDAFEDLADVHLDVHLYFAGEGPERAELEKRGIESRHAERIHVLGYRSDIPSLLQAADVFILPSLAESFGLVLLEAREYGLPIVGTTVGGIPQVLDYGACGLLVPPGDMHQLSRAISLLLTSDDLRLGLAARARDGLAEYSVQEHERRIRAVYNDLLAYPPNQSPPVGRRCR